jgi:hypothetical protein
MKIHSILMGLVVATTAACTGNMPAAEELVHSGHADGPQPDRAHPGVTIKARQVAARLFGAILFKNFDPGHIRDPGNSDDDRREFINAVQYMRKNGIKGALDVADALGNKPAVKQLVTNADIGPFGFAVQFATQALEFNKGVAPLQEIWDWRLAFWAVAHQKDADDGVRAQAIAAFNKVSKVQTNPFDYGDVARALADSDKFRDVILAMKPDQDDDDDFRRVDSNDPDADNPFERFVNDREGHRGRDGNHAGDGDRGPTGPTGPTTDRDR